ncbi:MAG: hypothetical protein ACR2FX_07835 [Chthoniobacterales bacterium]
MKIPFASLFQKSKERLAPATPKPKPEAPLPSVKKAEGERMGKTVLPSSARAAQGEQSQQPAGADTGGPIATEVARAALPAGATVQAPISPLSHTPSVPIQAGVAVADPTGETPVLQQTEVQRPKISMGATPAPMPHLPPAVAIALEPNIERAISLSLEDVIAQMPEGYLKPRESFDASRVVLLRAAEVEKGMATGRPAVSVAALFQQAPDIFMHTVPATDGAMVALPFERVMKALSNLPRRSDQAAEQAVPQVETPFLQVTIEDTERFGTPLPVMPAAAPETTELPPVRVEPASAEAFAAAVPEATETFVPQKAHGSGEASHRDAAASAPSERGAMRIPFTAPAEARSSEEFGTGEPAFPRVPASSGPPVPSAPAVGAVEPGGDSARPPSVAARIPFSFPAPSEEEKAEGQPKDEVGRMKDEGPVERQAETSRGATRSAAGEGGSYNVGDRSQQAVLTLPLRPILQLLPPMQLGGNPSTVAAGATVSFPMSLIGPQLASGKVVVKPNAFYAVLPDEYRKIFLADAVDAPVQLPLSDVLANLPGEALRMRQDQEVHAPPPQIFETPFSVKAAEDAARFAEKDKGGRRKDEQEQPAADGRRSSGTPSVAVSRELDPPASASHSSWAGAKFDAKEALARACALEGVDSCSVIFADGLNIAGNIPESMQLGGLSAVAPTLLQKIGKHMLQTSLGRLHCLTVYSDNAPVSFFIAGDICLTAVHRVELDGETRGELARITEELSRAYSETVRMGQ